ncbi:hypothetical protein QPK32_00460 [Massilia sp. YIM B02763]|uniref:hypothetical protein n=1 Tax=Massilia sp. YIM B02763 TaxID=3050130 RepID=UPI0025B6C126|nr:hypothetical protein [Massilia sp. YIM B02763]MDN4051554.1 hypothetical protein [Massilia sp. YIM B02763]
MTVKSILLIGLFLAGCASQTPSPQAANSPQQVISMAAESAPQPVFATVALQVRAVGNQHDVTYLNSESDYRDQRNVSIAISPAARRKVEAVFGGDLSKVATGKHILVKGRAQRVTIWFFDNNGQRSDKYYYQTQILVSDPAQIQII